MKDIILNKMIEDMKDKWPSAIVAREKVSEFTGGLISTGYIANLDCKGEGPDSIRIGRKVCYPVSSFLEWLKNRAIKNSF